MHLSNHNQYLNLWTAKILRAQVYNLQACYFKREIGISMHFTLTCNKFMMAIEKKWHAREKKYGRCKIR